MSPPPASAMSHPPASAKLRFIPTVGDGRCFFRSIAIGVDSKLQQAPRSSDGAIITAINQIGETAKSDNLRALTISQLCQSYDDVEPDGRILSADMPNGVKFDTMAERILAMSSPLTMIGEIEIVARNKMLKRKIEVVDDRGHHLVYGAAYTSQPPLYVRYIHNNDAGHYEAGLVIGNPASIGLPPTMDDISPIPVRGYARNQPSQSERHDLESHRYGHPARTKKPWKKTKRGFQQRRHQSQGRSARRQNRKKPVFVSIVSRMSRRT